MAQDVERVVPEDKSSLPDELSSFDEFVVTDTERLYGIDDEGRRQQITHLAHVVINFAAKASGVEVEALNPQRRGGGRAERNTSPADIEAMVQRLVDERISAATQGLEQQNQSLQEEVERLRAEVERLQKPLHERLDDAFGDRWVPRDKDVTVLRAQADGYLDDGWMTVSEPYERDGTWYTRIKKADSEEEEELNNLKRSREPAPVDEAAERQRQQTELETRITGYNGINLDNLYQTYRQNLQEAANQEERNAFANDATRAAVIAEIRGREVRDYIDSLNEQQRNALPADTARDLIAWLELRDAQELAIIPAAQPGETPEGMPEGSRPVYRRRSWFGRNWDRARGRPVREFVPTGVYSDGEGRYIRRIDEEIVEVPPAEVDRRQGAVAVAVGAAALAGAAVGILLYEYFEDRHLGHSPTREMRHNGMWYPGKNGTWWPGGHPKAAPEHPIPTGHGVNGLPNGTHTDFYNPALNHRRTAVEASSSIKLVGNPGNEHLVDGHKVLLGGHKVEWDSQGKLSWWDKMRLKKDGYDIGWGKLEDKIRGVHRLKTIVVKR